MTEQSSTVTNWKVSQLDDLTGRTYLITGGNSGIGFEAAAHLRRANADVIITARNTSKGDEAVTGLERLEGTGSVTVVQLDLADLASVRSAAEAVRGQTDGLDAVINNAGIMQTPQLQTVDGVELQFGTNHLGHFLLNHLVFDLLDARSGRIVPVSSVAHHGARSIKFDDPMFSKGYTPTKAYAQSKLANLMYGIELARRLEAAGSDVISVSAHPGYSATNLQSTGPTGLFKFVYKFSNRVMAQSATDGAVPEVLAAAGREARNGAYYGPTRLGDSRGPVGDSRMSDAAQDPDAGSRLWALSEDLLGIEWKVG